MAKGLKLKVKKFWGLIPTSAEVRGKKRVSPILLYFQFSCFCLHWVVFKSQHFSYQQNQIETYI